jgi:protein tyrosine phosphatase
MLLTCVYSAGVGRTCCFIVIDSMLERMRHEKMIDIYGHVTCLRAQRNYMVQVKYCYQEFSVILGIRFKENITFKFT